MVIIIVGGFVITAGRIIVLTVEQTRNEVQQPIERSGQNRVQPMEGQRMQRIQQPDKARRVETKNCALSWNQKCTRSFFFLFSWSRTWTYINQSGDNSNPPCGSYLVLPRNVSKIKIKQSSEFVYQLTQPSVDIPSPIANKAKASSIASYYKPLWKQKLKQAIHPSIIILFLLPTFLQPPIFVAISL